MPPSPKNNSPLVKGFPSHLDGAQVGYFGSRYVEPPSVTLRKKGYEYIEELEQDTHLRGQLEYRFRQAINPGWQIDPASDSKLDREVANFVNYCLDNMEGTFVSALMKIWDAVAKGFSLLEPQFEILRDGPFTGNIRLKKLKHIPAKFVRFQFDEYGNIAADGVVLYDSPATRWREAKDNNRTFRYADFVHAVYGPTDNPYGDSAVVRCAYWVWSKKEVAKMWAYFLETFGAPGILVEMPQSSGTKTDSNAEQAIVENFIQHFRAFGGAALPKGFAAKLLEATRSGDPSYEAFERFANNEISKIVIGATLATEGGGKSSGASYALGKQHGSVAETYAYTDALWIEYLVNTQIVRRIVGLNYRVPDFPKFRLLEDKLSGMIGVAQALQSLTQAGVKIPEAWVYSRLGIPAPAKQEPVLKPLPAGGGQAAAANPKGTDNRLRSSDSRRDTIHRVRNQQFAEIDELVSNLARQNKIDQLAALTLIPAIRKLFDKLLEQAETSTEFPTLNTGEFKRGLMRAAALYYLVGKADAADAVRAKGYELPEGETSPKTPQALKPKAGDADALEVAAAVTAFAKFLPMTTAELSGLSGQLDSQFYDIAGLFREDMQKIWSLQVQAVKEGMDLKLFRNAVKNELIVYAGDVWNQPTAGNPILERHIELIYRNGMSRNYRQGKDNLFQDPIVDEFLLGFRYNAILDDKVRHDHAILDGITLPKNHPFWQYRTPPWDHNDRCDREPVMAGDIESGLYSWTPDSQLPADFQSPPPSGFTA